MEFLRNLSLKLLAALVVFSSLSWTMEEHYCMGRLVDVSIFGESHGCGMEMEDTDPRQGNEKKDSCCDDQVVVFDGQDQLKLNKDYVGFSQPVLSVCWYSVLGSFLLTTPDLIPPAEYPPPPIYVEDIQLLYEVFLI